MLSSDVPSLGPLYIQTGSIFRPPFSGQTT